ncbi:MAG: DNA-3-methyladenine glycosylase family protein [Candidatus Limnocylindrales bacterium]|jgi:3-methyladenine DNA glycosylase/8-oxoguanine DNA glycosylase
MSLPAASDASRPADAEAILPVDGPYDLGRTLGPLAHGRGDPTIRVEADRVRRATRTPDGPAAQELVLAGASIRIRAWGPGAGWLVDHAVQLLGLADRPAEFRPGHPLLDELARRYAGVRIGRTEAVVEALVPAILEQKITGDEARRVYRSLIREHGIPAPGPLGLRLGPSADRLAGLPYYAFHPLGLERRRAELLRRIGAAAGRLEALTRIDPADAGARLQQIPGIGPWTAGEVGRVALGDPDAVSIGDYHLPSLVCFVLAGERSGDDARMLELLEPWRGQRGRVVRWLELGSRDLAGLGPARRGPRLPSRSIGGL